MTARIIQFKKSNLGKPKASPEVEKSNAELFVEAYEDVITDWRRYAGKNRLNEYVMNKLPPSCINPSADYTNDLNVIAAVEQRLAMTVSVFYPGCVENQNGWMATFHLGEEIFSTPSDMASEANARALLIVLFLHFHNVLKNVNRVVS